MPVPSGLPDRPARTLTADVRERSDAELAGLVRARPDLALPPPADLTSLVARAASRASTQRALDGLNRGELDLLVALAGAGDPVDLGQVADEHATAAAALVPAVTTLWRRALLWRGPAGFHVPRSVQEALAALLPGSRPPTDPRPETGPPPALSLSPPELPVRERAGLDHAGGAEAGTLLGLVDELAVRWGQDPPRVLRSGGLAVRDLRAAQRWLDTTAEHAAFVVELSYAAGLVAPDGEADPCWAPTPAYDLWVAAGPAQRWTRLAEAWWQTPRAPCLVGSAGESGTVNALTAQTVWPLARQLRQDTMAELSALGADSVAEAAGVVERLLWRRPLRPEPVVRLLVDSALQEAVWTGLAAGSGAGWTGATSAGRALAAGDLEGALRGIQVVLPDPVEHVVVQADLTAVAPGRAEGPLADLLRLLADVESRGGATVHRFTAASIRRGLDAGWSAQEVLDRLSAASRTPLPQPLEYLVRDVARVHGAVRVGAAQTYLRSDDVVTLDEMLADRRLSPLQLRRVAPTVLVSSAPGPTVLGMLRDKGFGPLAERADGSVLAAPAPVHRTPPRQLPHARTRPVLDDPSLAALVQRLRAGEVVRQQREDAQRSGPNLPASDPAVTLSLLREAAADQTRVWVGHTDRDGQVRRVLFLPHRVLGGRAYGTVEGSEVEQVLSVHRITGVAAV